LLIRRLVGGGAPTPSFQLPMTDRTAQAMLFIRRVNARAGSNLEPFDYHYDNQLFYRTRNDFLIKSTTSRSSEVDV